MSGLSEDFFAQGSSKLDSKSYGSSFSKASTRGSGSDPMRISSSLGSNGYSHISTPESSYLYKDSVYSANYFFIRHQEERLQNLYMDLAKAKEVGREEDERGIEAKIKALEGLYNPYNGDSPLKITPLQNLGHAAAELENEGLRKKIAALEAEKQGLSDEVERLRLGSADNDGADVYTADPTSPYAGIGIPEALREPAPTTGPGGLHGPAPYPGYDPLLASQFPYGGMVPPVGVIPSAMPGGMSPLGHQMMPPGYGMDPYLSSAAYNINMEAMHMQMAANQAQAGAAKAAKSAGKGVKGKPQKLVEDGNKPTEEIVNELEREFTAERTKLAKAEQATGEGQMRLSEYQALKSMADERIEEIERDLEPLNETLRNKGVKTVMVRNIPNDYTRTMLTELLDEKGFNKKYDFVYLPYDFHRESGLGYAFVNMVSFQAAQEIKRALSGYSDWKKKSTKIVEVNWGHPVQGKAEHIERYRNSPVMHKDIQDEYKPALFEDGIKIPFPEPTRAIQPPRKKSTKK